MAYTFVRPVLQGGGVGAGSISVLLLAFGAAGVCGNFIAGALVTRDLRRHVLGIAVILTAAMAALTVAGTGAFSAGAVLVLWGLGYGAVPVTLQSWILDAAPNATEAASSLYVSAFNLSIALGALVGGLTVDSLGTTSVLWTGAALTALAWPVVRRARRTATAPVT
ncbi:MFS transporter [Streptomyces californicus]|uniref:MFS transporter n=1 Tax=Streptomyces TaxID=1883 RepID=UPI0027E42C8E|nr:MFS transporter [Streptomyces violaceoruber]MCF3168466.1 MFS transporter [Streptomyces violaceoruber]